MSIKQIVSMKLAEFWDKQCNEPIGGIGHFKEVKDAFVDEKEKLIERRNGKGNSAANHQPVPSDRGVLYNSDE